MGLYLSLAPGL
ncbi:hypothetical protein Zm00014a_042010 [Zea mays]|uniref:Uncharacterized protein n=1 Tax=Zea mays TaxID=4577 RepID=A0A3L6DM77_MAIZE|nr:hypothetical protein Zm00014a_042010 [Zea mays]